MKQRRPELRVDSVLARGFKGIDVEDALTVIAQPGKLHKIVEEGLVNTLPGCA
jgi:hypothetical protein